MDKEQNNKLKLENKVESFRKEIRRKSRNSNFNEIRNKLLVEFRS